MIKAAEAVEQIRRRRPGELYSCFGHLIKESYLRGTVRRRGFDAPTTFWAFLGQTLRGGSCRDGLLEVQAARARAGLSVLSSSTAGYCKARKQRLFVEDLKAIHNELSFELRKGSCWQWNHRDVYAVDGTCLSLADTQENQDEFPQPGKQKPGCGFPVMQLVGLFHLGSGALCHYEDSPMRVHESALFHCAALMGKLKACDVLVADRAYCSYLNFAQAAGRGIDVVARLHQGRPSHFPKGRNEMRVQWSRPSLQSMPEYISRKEWEDLPETIEVRYLRIRPDEGRCETIVLATTIMDDSIESIAGLFLRRWRMEVTFRDLKNTLGMDDLMVRCPDMARKTVAMFMIAHNLIRWTMGQAARTHQIDLQRLSFKGTIDALMHWKTKLHNSPSGAEKRTNWHLLLDIIARDPNPLRPHRCEPRVKKRRPKIYQLMTAPRKLMTVSPSRRQK